MIIFLYGQDIYRLREKLNEIIEHYKKIHKSGLNLKYFDNRSLNFEDFRDEIKQTSMFDEKKLMVLTDVSNNLEFKENFLKNSKELLNSKEIILFSEGRELPKGDKFFSFLKKEAKSQEFNYLEGVKLKNWLKKEFAKFKVEISPESLDRLINFVGNDLWQMSNEIKKISTFKLGGKIEREDIELLVRPKIESDIFKTIDAIATKNKKQALALIHKHLEKGDNPLYLLSMINFQFRNLLMIRDLIEKKKPIQLFSKLTNLHPYIIKKSYPQALKFKLEELKKIYQKIFKIDLAIKTGQVKPELALDLFVAEI
jgi:DNA polymerase-3 subunit delta